MITLNLFCIFKSFIHVPFCTKCIGTHTVLVNVLAFFSILVLENEWISVCTTMCVCASLNEQLG